MKENFSSIASEREGRIEERKMEEFSSVLYSILAHA